MIAFRIVLYKTAVSLTKEKQAMNSDSQGIQKHLPKQGRNCNGGVCAVVGIEGFRLTLSLNLDLYGN